MNKAREDSELNIARLVGHIDHLCILDQQGIDVTKDKNWNLTEPEQVSVENQLMSSLSDLSNTMQLVQYNATGISGKM